MQSRCEVGPSSSGSHWPFGFFILWDTSELRAADSGAALWVWVPFSSSYSGNHPKPVEDQKAIAGFHSKGQCIAKASEFAQ